MQHSSTSPSCWHPPSGPNPPHFERSDHDYTQRINQPDPCDDFFQYPETPQEEAAVPFHPLQWPRQAPASRGVQNYNLDPFAGTSPVDEPAMKPALTYNAPPFSEGLASLNDPYAYSSTGPSARHTMEYPGETSRTMNQVRRENVAFTAPPLPRPAVYNAYLPPEVSSNNVFGVDSGPIPFLLAYQGDFGGNSAFSPPDSRGAAYMDPMNGLARQIYSEDVHRTSPLVHPPAALVPSMYGESVSNENETSPEFVQWLKSINKNNPTNNGYAYPPEGYGEPNPLRGIGEGIQSSPETTIISLSPTLSRSLQTQPGLRRVAPWPRTSPAREEPQLKNSKKITPISLPEAEAIIGPKILEYWGTSKNIPDPLLWETRSVVEGGGSVKKRSKCKICGSLCVGSAALYHARKHLNLNTHPCPYPGCPNSFAQSSDRRNHVEKIHQKHIDQPSTPPTSSQVHLNNPYHG